MLTLQKDQRPEWSSKTGIKFPTRQLLVQGVLFVHNLHTLLEQMSSPLFYNRGLCCSIFNITEVVLNTIIPSLVGLALSIFPGVNYWKGMIKLTELVLDNMVTWYVNQWEAAPLLHVWVHNARRNRNRVVHDSYLSFGLTRGLACIAWCLDIHAVCLSFWGTLFRAFSHLVQC
jgi:hypothetical protein